MEKEITIEKIREEDAGAIEQLYETYLNSGGYIRSHVLEGIRSRDYIGYRAVQDAATVGFVSGRSGIDFTCPHPWLEADLRKRFPEKEMYSPDALAVAGSCRRRHVAGRLWERLLQDVRQKGFQLLVMELWVYPDGSIPAEAVVSKTGKAVFEKTVAGFYRDAGKYGIECPVCGKNCACGAKIKVMDISL